MASKRGFKPPVKKQVVSSKVKGVSRPLSNSQYEEIFDAVVQNQGNTSPQQAESRKICATSPRESASLENSQSSQPDSTTDAKINQDNAATADSETQSVQDSSSSLTKQSVASKIPESSAGHSEDTKDSCSENTKFKRPKTLREALKVQESNSQFSSSLSQLASNSSLLTQDAVLSQPPKHLRHRERLQWLQDRRGVGLWIQCDVCRKWRWSDIDDPVDVPKRWICSMNPDTNYSQCVVPEKPISVYIEEDLIHNEYTAGSIVWAKLFGYPWWPAMVDDCPDTEQYYWLDGYSDIPTQYHVVFFDNEHNQVSRAWVELRDMISYKHEPHVDRKFSMKPADKYRVERAKLQADEAVKLRVKQRLQRYSFLARWTKDIVTPPPSDSELEESYSEDERTNNKQDRKSSEGKETQKGGKNKDKRATNTDRDDSSEGKEKQKSGRNKSSDEEKQKAKKNKDRQANNTERGDSSHREKQRAKISSQNNDTRRDTKLNNSEDPKIDKSNRRDMKLNEKEDEKRRDMKANRESNKQSNTQLSIDNHSKHSKTTDKRASKEIDKPRDTKSDKKSHDEKKQKSKHSQKDTQDAESNKKDRHSSKHKDKTDKRSVESDKNDSNPTKPSQQDVQDNSVKTVDETPTEQYKFKEHNKSSEHSTKETNTNDDYNSTKSTNNKHTSDTGAVAESQSAQESNDDSHKLTNELAEIVGESTVGNSDDDDDETQDLSLDAEEATGDSSADNSEVEDVFSQSSDMESLCSQPLLDEAAAEQDYAAADQDKAAVDQDKEAVDPDEASAEQAEGSTEQDAAAEQDDVAADEDGASADQDEPAADQNKAAAEQDETQLLSTEQQEIQKFIKQTLGDNVNIFDSSTQSLDDESDETMERLREHIRSSTVTNLDTDLVESNQVDNPIEKGLTQVAQSTPVDNPTEKDLSVKPKAKRTAKNEKTAKRTAKNKDEKTAKSTKRKTERDSDNSDAEVKSARKKSRKTVSKIRRDSAGNNEAVKVTKGKENKEKQDKKQIVKKLNIADFTLKRQQLSKDNDEIKPKKIAKSDSKTTKRDATLASSDSKVATSDSKTTKRDATLASSNSKVATSDSKTTKRDTTLASSDNKIATSGTKVAKSDTKTAKSDSKVAKRDTKAAKSNSKTTKRDTTLASRDTNTKSSTKAAKSDANSAINKPSTSDLKKSKKPKFFQPPVRNSSNSETSSKSTASSEPEQHPDAGLTSSQSANTGAAVVPDSEDRLLEILNGLSQESLPFDMDP